MCQPCNIKGCVDCSNFGRCTSCFQGYYLVSSSLCEICPQGCSQCSSSISCSACLPGYTLNPLTNRCDPCSANCLTCNGKSCSRCRINYFSNPFSNNCSICDTNCEECSGSNTCGRCRSGYFLDASRCVQCSSNC